MHRSNASSAAAALRSATRPCSPPSTASARTPQLSSCSSSTARLTSWSSTTSTRSPRSASGSRAAICGSAACANGISKWRRICRMRPGSPEKRLGIAGSYRKCWGRGFPGAGKVSIDQSTCSSPSKCAPAATHAGPRKGAPCPRRTRPPAPKTGSTTGPGRPRCARGFAPLCHRLLRIRTGSPGRRKRREPGRRRSRRVCDPRWTSRGSHPPRRD